MTELSEENMRLREALVRIKYLSPNSNISIAQDIAENAIDLIPIRDHKTGEEFPSGREETRGLHN